MSIDAFYKGENAYYCQYTIGDNEFPHGTIEHISWILGYMYAYHCDHNL
jgi:hypothetical protein